MNKPLSLLISLTLGLAILAPVADASPRDRAAKAKPTHAGAQRHVDRQAGHVSRTTGDGHTFERHVDTVKTENGYTRTMEGTTPNGDSFSREVSSTRDPETGSWTKQVNITTPSGKTISTTIDAQRTEDGYTTTVTHTGPDGTDVRRDTVATRDEDGSLSKDVTHEVTANTPPPQNDDASE